MCGIVGIWQRFGQPEVAVVERMREALAHRGPDMTGLWCDGALAFGHRRLSIVELSPLGHQPMLSADQRFVICFNGEVFNFLELRRELEALGHRFAGHSDTEVMLAACCAWGVRGAVQRFVGMFAFALWDRQERLLHLVRDRIGIKPLYIGRTQDGDFLFASELKAFPAHPGFSRRVNPDAVAAFLKYGYVPAPLSIYRDASKLKPGHILTLASPADNLTATAPFWSLDAVAEQGAAAPFEGDVGEAEDALDTLLRDAVRLRMIADVPLGAFLSGGVDSSLVVSLMQAQSMRPVQTFTVGFTETRYNEATHARHIAQHLGTAHTELILTPTQVMAVIPRLPGMYDEPFADSSQIPTFLVSELARRHVTVSLSGDGGDELFGGYSRYRRCELAWGAVGWLPRWARGALAQGMRAPAALSDVGHASRIGKVADWLGAAGPETMYERLVVATPDPRGLLRREAAEDYTIRRLVSLGASRPLVARFMFADTKVYLPDDLLAKLDRATMAVSLEGRVPLLDHRVVEWAWRLPIQLRRSKSLLKRVLARYVPRPLFERPKMGFEVPLAAWLRGPLRDWATGSLTSGEFGGDGLFDRGAVAAAWHRVVAGHRETSLIWNLLMFEEWRRHWQATS